MIVGFIKTADGYGFGLAEDANSEMLYADLFHTEADLLELWTADVDTRPDVHGVGKIYDVLTAALNGGASEVRFTV